MPPSAEIRLAGDGSRSIRSQRRRSCSQCPLAVPRGGAGHRAQPSITAAANTWLMIPREGFEALSSSPFAGLVGPLYVDRSAARTVVRVRVADQHTNSFGKVHGGLLSTVADVAIGQAEIGRAHV